MEARCSSLKSFRFLPQAAGNLKVPALIYVHQQSLKGINAALCSRLPAFASRLFFKLIKLRVARER